MSKINLVVLGGNLTRDPELKYTPAGTALCEFTIANSKKYKKNEEWVEKPGFYNCICWGRRGEIINEHFSKGKPIEVQGELDFQQWETEEGQKRSAVKINVSNFFFVGARDGNASAGSSSGGAQEPSFPGDNREDVNEEEIPF